MCSVGGRPSTCVTDVLVCHRACRRDTKYPSGSPAHPHPTKVVLETVIISVSSLALGHVWPHLRASELELLACRRVLCECNSRSLDGVLSFFEQDTMNRRLQGQEASRHAVSGVVCLQPDVDNKFSALISDFISDRFCSSFGT